MRRIYIISTVDLALVMDIIFDGAVGVKAKAKLEVSERVVVVESALQADSYNDIVFRIGLDKDFPVVLPPFKALRRRLFNT